MRRNSRKDSGGGEKCQIQKKKMIGSRKSLCDLLREKNMFSLLSIKAGGRLACLEMAGLWLSQGGNSNG